MIAKCITLSDKQHQFSSSLRSCTSSSWIGNSVLETLCDSVWNSCGFSHFVYTFIVKPILWTIFWYFIAYRDKNLEENFKSIKQRRLFLSVKEQKFNSKCVKKGNLRSLWSRVNVTVTLEHDYCFFTKMGIFAYVKQ